MQWGKPAEVQLRSLKLPGASFGSLERSQTLQACFGDCLRFSFWVGRFAELGSAVPRLTMGKSSSLGNALNQHQEQGAASPAVSPPSQFALSTGRLAKESPVMEKMLFTVLRKPAPILGVCRQWTGGTISSLKRLASPRAGCPGQQWSSSFLSSAAIVT